ncbi:MAG: class I SAM-dependent methyltransferase [Acidimicrobiales bacterium]
MPNYYDRVFEWGIENHGELATLRKVEGRVDVWQRLLSAAGLSPRSVLDIGCNDGSLARLMANSHLGENFTLCDVSPAAIDYVKSRPFPGLSDVAVSDAQALPFPDTTFDLAVLSHIVEHLPQPREAIVEASRVARIVLVEVPLQDRLLSNAAAVALKRRSGMPRSINGVGHIHFFSDTTFRNMAEQWDDVSILESTSYLPPGRSKWKVVASHVLGHRFYSKLLEVHAVYIFERNRAHQNSSHPASDGN